MEMAGEQRIAAPRQRVWEALNDPEVLRASIPGCQSLEKLGDDRFAATVEVKIGPIGARFKGGVTLADLDPPSGYTLLLEGNGGIAGSMRGSARVRLREEGGATVVAYTVDAQVGGRMAQLGGPIIDATARQLAGKFFGRFGEIVGGSAAQAPVTEPMPVNSAAGSAASPPLAATASPSPLPAVAAHPEETPKSSPLGWILAVVVAALVGFLVGRGAGGVTSDWAGLAIGLLLLVVAGAAFEYGRRAGSTTLLLDSALLRRLLEEPKR